MSDTSEREKLERYVADELKQENLWTKLWSLLHHGFVFSAAVLSALAALTLQLKSIGWEAATRADVAAGLAAIASLVGVISASGGFGDKWRANRLTKGTLEQLQIELMDPACDLSRIRTELKDMKRVHHLAILGEREPQKDKK
jgi:hypothetical protein